ncbi:uncharacterized protein L201_005220 [Kwoniella dendrophila CBS 6074]|uniref:Ricin B lectin domain-containing protein n=1 Tax=Kwoniella dendrophila CBS 6074 TaxID=1295534 RepID=A0AAX4JY52_9TREE
MYLSSILSLLIFTSTIVEASPINKRYSGVKIQSYRSRKCLSPIGPSITFGDGTLVATVDCNQAKTWDINPGSGSVLLHDNNRFALDAGDGRTNNEIVKLWTSYPTLFQQTWFLTGDLRIAITGGDQCLDESENGPQTYKCYTGNTNQIWYILDGGNSTPPPASSSASPSVTSSATQPSQSSTSEVFKDPSNTSRRIHPNNDNGLCVTAGNGFITAGSSVNIAACYDTKDPVFKAQSFNIAAGSKSDYIRSASNSNLCLDVGTNPGSGSRVYISDCSSTTTTVTKWNYMVDKISVDGKNLCLDRELNSGTTKGRSLDYLANLQVWECFPDNQQQLFTLYPL